MSRLFNIRRGSHDEVLQIHRRVPELRPPRSIADYIDKIDSRDRVALFAEA